VLDRPQPAWVRRRFTAAHFDRARLVAEGHEHMGLTRFTGVEVVDCGPGWAVERLRIRPDLMNEMSVMHGGMVGYLADDAMGFAAFTLLTPEQNCLTVEYKINFLAPVTGDWLIARGQVVRAGRTMLVLECELAAETAGKEKLVAASLGTFMIIANPAVRKG
jgi:uncharacterized protein (TIGR00369 family)